MLRVMDSSRRIVLSGLVLACLVISIACTGPENSVEPLSRSSVTVEVLHPDAPTPNAATTATPEPPLSIEPTASFEATVTVDPPTEDAQPTTVISSPTSLSQPSATNASDAIAECTEPPRPPEYISFEAGLLSAIAAATGDRTKLGTHIVQLLREHALLIRNTYHLATADVGKFNNDTTAYFDWLTDFVMHLMDGSDSTGEFADLDEHLHRQFAVAIEEPTSEIGATIKCLERKANEISFLSGSYVYWTHLYGPIAWRSSGNSIITRLLVGSFDAAVTDYQTLAISNPSVPDFGTFLDEREFARLVGIEPTLESASQTPVPTTAETNVSSDIPRDGSVLYDRPLSGWSSAQYDRGWSEPSNTSFHIGVYATSVEQVVESWTDRNDFADASVSVDVREISDQANAAGCISIRHDFANGDYSFCMMGNGQTWAAYHYIDSASNWNVETLLWPEIRSGTKPSSQWNTLKIIARGGQIWFVANNHVLGISTHNARSVGAIAVSVTNWDLDVDAEFEFKNLVVRDLE